MNDPVRLQIGGQANLSEPGIPMMPLNVVKGRPVKVYTVSDLADGARPNASTDETRRMGTHNLEAEFITFSSKPLLEPISGETQRTPKTQQCVAMFYARGRNAGSITPPDPLSICENCLVALQAAPDRSELWRNAAGVGRPRRTTFRIGSGS